MIKLGGHGDNTGEVMVKDKIMKNKGNYEMNINDTIVEQNVELKWREKSLKETVDYEEILESFVSMIDDVIIEDLINSTVGTIYEIDKHEHFLTP